MTPSSRASAKPIDGLSACSSSFSNSPQMRSAGSRLGVDGQFEPRRELQGTENTEGIVREAACIHDPEDTEMKVPAAVEWIEVLVGQRIPADGVDREVAPARRLLEGHRRIAGDGEPFVPAAGLRLAAG
jgi:hypothetical protein